MLSSSSGTRPYSKHAKLTKNQLSAEISKQLRKPLKKLGMLLVSTPRTLMIGLPSKHKLTRQRNKSRPVSSPPLWKPISQQRVTKVLNVTLIETVKV